RLGEPGLRDYPSDSTYLHHELALAYADITSMAMGRDAGTIFVAPPIEWYEGFPSDASGNVNLTSIRAETPEARRKSFAHPRAALSATRDPIARAAMWNLMFRAVAGIPGSISFICHGD